MRINFAFVLLCFILFPFFVQTFPVLSKIYWLFSAIFTPFLVIFIFRKRDKFSISFDSLLFLLISLFVVNFYFSLKSAGLHEDYVLKNAIRAFFSTLGFLSIILLTRQTKNSETILGLWQPKLALRSHKNLADDSLSKKPCNPDCQIFF